MLFAFLFSCLGGFILYPIVMMFALGGLITGFFGKGGMKVAGLTLNSIALAPAVIMAIVTVVAMLGMGGAAVVANSAGSGARPSSRQTATDTSSRRSDTAIPLPSGDDADAQGDAAKQAAADKEAAEQAAELERLNTDKAALLANTTVGKAWKGRIVITGETPIELLLTFIESDNDGQNVALLAENLADPTARNIFRGTLKQVKPSYNNPDPTHWELEAATARGSSWLPDPYHWPPMTFRAPSGDDPNAWSVAFAKSAVALMLVPEEKPSLPEVDQQQKLVKAAVAPGACWTGTSQAPGESTQNVTLTFAAYQDDGGYCRAVLEPKDDPWSVSVFEGAVTVDDGKAYTWPVSLKSGRNAMRLTLMRDGALVGVHDGNHQLRLNPAPRVENVVAYDKSLHDAIAPGTVWEGTTQFGVEPVQYVAITFAEVRENGGYVRLVLTPKDKPLPAVVFEGTLQSDPGQINGYSLLMQPKNRAGGEYDTIFGTSHTDFNYSLKLRLSLDGTTLLGSTRYGNLRLTRPDSPPVLLDLSTAALSKKLLEICAKDTVFAGKLTNLKAGQSINVQMKIVGVSPDGKNLQMLAFSPQVRGPNIGFEGVFATDDANINDAAIQLKKVGAGTFTGSTVFGKSTGDELRFRLAPDGSKLFGWAEDEILVLSPAVDDSSAKKAE